MSFFLKDYSNYLKKDKNFIVVDLANEAIGRMIKRIDNVTIIKNDRLG